MIALKNQIVVHRRQQCRARINNLYMVEYLSDDEMRQTDRGRVDQRKTTEDSMSGDTSVCTVTGVMVKLRRMEWIVKQCDTGW